jgi:hypothetical protein
MTRVRNRGSEFGIRDWGMGLPIDDGRLLRANCWLMIAPRDENAVLMQMMQASSLCQLWRLTKVLFRARTDGLTLRDVKNEDRSGYMYDNKDEHDKMSIEQHAFYTQMHQFRDNRQQSSRLLGRKYMDCKINKGEVELAFRGVKGRKSGRWHGSPAREQSWPGWLCRKGPGGTSFTSAPLPHSRNLPTVGCQLSAISRPPSAYNPVMPVPASWGAIYAARSW